jgi:hypothetical protein
MKVPSEVAALWVKAPEAARTSEVQARYVRAAHPKLSKNSAIRICSALFFPAASSFAWVHGSISWGLHISWANLQAISGRRAYARIRKAAVSFLPVSDSHDQNEDVFFTDRVYGDVFLA